MNQLQHFGYLLVLVISLGGLTLLDLRSRRLIAKRSVQIALAGCVATLLIGDLVGIWLGIFSANPAYLSGLYLLPPDLPLEELFLLTLISYLAILSGYRR
ncbi:MAG: lycopene cyclase domain-containing protein [bacterium]